MKFEKVLPLMRNGSKFKCGDQSGYYMICRKTLFDIDLGTGICNISTERNSNDIFHWGVDGNSLISKDWEIFEKDKHSEINKIESILGSAIEQTIFSFFMRNTLPFTTENALLPPLSKPLAEQIMNMINQFFDERKIKV
jgi:hypothetical protein